MTASAAGGAALDLPAGGRLMGKTICLLRKPESRGDEDKNNSILRLKSLMLAQHARDYRRLAHADLKNHVLQIN